MEMKEFYYEDGIRVSLFNLDHKSVPFHKHDNVSDIMFCSKGCINIELPDLKKKIKVEEGSSFQIPVGTRHRFTNGSDPGKGSRYVLMQLGNFNIRFERDHASLQDSLKHVDLELSNESSVYLDNRKLGVLALANYFATNKPKELTEDEIADVK